MGAPPRIAPNFAKCTPGPARKLTVAVAYPVAASAATGATKKAARAMAIGTRRVLIMALPLVVVDSFLKHKCMAIPVVPPAKSKGGRVAPCTLGQPRTSDGRQ